MAKWTYFPDQIPENNQLCWIRLSTNQSRPFKATYISAYSEFWSEDNEIHYPAWCVFSWKNVTE